MDYFVKICYTIIEQKFATAGTSIIICNCCMMSLWWPLIWSDYGRC